jgi:hypothetical protein
VGSVIPVSATANAAAAAASSSSGIGVLPPPSVGPSAAGHLQVTYASFVRRHPISAAAAAAAAAAATPGGGGDGGADGGDNGPTVPPPRGFRVCREWTVRALKQKLQVRG